jgi:hypothetical protein
VGSRPSSPTNWSGTVRFRESRTTPYDIRVYVVCGNCSTWWPARARRRATHGGGREIRRCLRLGTSAWTVGTSVTHCGGRECPMSSTRSASLRRRSAG